MLPYENHRCRRIKIIVSLAVGILLAVIGAACSSSKTPPSPGTATSPATPAAEPPALPALPTSSSPITYPGPISSTAILFLVDESGGVSGRCPQRPTVDQEGIRWDIVRFYISVWRAWYEAAADPLWPCTSAESWPSFKVGVAAFARDVQMVLPFTEISELDQSEGWRRLLESRDPIPDKSDNDWFCRTAYSSTLQKSAGWLENQDASQRILILLTDGSFEGILPPGDRDVRRSEVANILNDLDARGITVRALLLGEDQCRYGQSEGCDLSEAEKAEREQDLRVWEKWKVRYSSEKDGMFRALGEGVFREFSLFPTPGYWGSGPGIVSPTLIGRTEEVAGIVVTGKKVEWGTLHLYGEDGREIHLTPYRPGQWFRGEQSVESHPQTVSACPARQWHLKINEQTPVYVWFVTAERQVDIASMSVVSEVRVGRDEFLTVTIGLTNLPEPAPCYGFSATLKVTSADTQYRRDCPLVSSSGSEQVFRCDLRDVPLKWGLVDIEAQLIYPDAPDASPSPRTSQVRAIVEPRFGQIIAACPKTGEEPRGVITIPVENGMDIPDFKLYPSLYPAPFGKGQPPPTALPNCLGTDPEAMAEEWFTGCLSTVSESTLYVRCKLPCGQFVEEPCRYRWLRLRWEGSGGGASGGDIWWGKGSDEKDIIKWEPDDGSRPNP